MTFDVELVRRAYPALSDGFAYLDGAAGTQLPFSVIDAVAETWRVGCAYAGGVFPASQRSTGIVAECRSAIADLVGGASDGVIIGPNMTTLTYRLAMAMAKKWTPGDEVVVCRLDHDANIRPWIQAAERVGAAVRWAELDPKTGELPIDQYDTLLNDRTRLVAVTAASNVLGTRPDVAAITAKAHAVGALSFVDGVHATAHGAIDMRALGADFYATSAYKWAGPHLGAIVSNPAVLEAIHPDKLEPAKNDVPARFETGAPSYASLAGAAAAVEHLAGLDPAASGSRRARLLASMSAAEEHEQRLFRLMLAGLADMPDVTTYGAATDRTATAYFNIAGLAPSAVATHLASRKINTWNGHNYAWEVTGVLGIRESGGAVRAGLVHYNNEGEINRLLAGIAELTDRSGNSTM